MLNFIIFFQNDLCSMAFPGYILANQSSTLKTDYQVLNFGPSKILMRYSYIFVPSMPARKISHTKRFTLLYGLR